MYYGGNLLKFSANLLMHNQYMQPVNAYHCTHKIHRSGFSVNFDIFLLQFLLQL